MKICTMNCGPALGDTRTAEERRGNCDDCVTVCPDNRNFIVVIGRAHGDDEDHARSYGDMTVPEARQRFINEVRYDEGICEEDVVKEYETANVYITHVLTSQSPIKLEE